MQHEARLKTAKQAGRRYLTDPLFALTRVEVHEDNRQALKEVHYY